MRRGEVVLKVYIRSKYVTTATTTTTTTTSTTITTITKTIPFQKIIFTEILLMGLNIYNNHTIEIRYCDTEFTFAALCT